MRFRLTRPEDLAIARDFVPACYGYAAHVREALPTIWAGLLQAGQLNTAVVEDPSLPPGKRVRGVGFSVFVSDDFADDALAAPVPYLNARLHEMILAGRSPVLDSRQIAEANCNGGLTLMPLHFATASFDTADPEVMRTLAAAHDLFRLVHAGYRVKRIVKEVVGVGLYRYMLSSGMKLHTDYSDLASGAGLASLAAEERPFLLAAEHSELPVGSFHAMNFITGEVRFRFSPAEQKLLFCALLHETDEDIAGDLGLSPDTLRKQWRSIYERVLSADPLFFPDEPERNGRGREKRRHLLRYLRLHMEELRPHREPPSRRRAGERPAPMVVA
jgi:hypothetical protein